MGCKSPRFGEGFLLRFRCLDKKKQEADGPLPALYWSIRKSQPLLADDSGRLEGEGGLQTDRPRVLPVKGLAILAVDGFWAVLTVRNLATNWDAIEGLLHIVRSSCRSIERNAVEYWVTARSNIVAAVVARVNLRIDRSDCVLVQEVGESSLEGNSL